MSAPEEWRPVVGFEGLYEVSSFGRVKAIGAFRDWTSRTGTPFKRFVPGKILKLQKHSGDYVQIGLQGRTYLVHDLVARAFIGPRPEGYEVCHRDGNRKNNRKGNLRYDHHIANCADRKEHGFIVEGEKNPQAKLLPEHVEKIRSLSGAVKQCDIGEMFGIGQAQVSRIINGKRWQHV